MIGRCFIVTGLQPWDIPIGSNAIDIAKELSRKNKVLYVNSALDMMTILKNGQKPEYQRRIAVLIKKERPLRQVSDSLWVLDTPFSVWPVNGLPDGFLFDYFNRINNNRIFRFAKKKAAQLGFNDIIHFIDNDIYRSFYSKEILKPSLSVYYRRDNLQPFAYWRKHAGRLEPLLIQKSDLVVCNSPQLAAFARQFNENSHNVGQGLDLSAYNPSMANETPDIFSTIPKPVVGYIGDITSLRLDPDLLFELAKSKPSYSFVMIGKEDPVFRAHALHSLPNVYFPGSIPKTKVAIYMNAFDVCINPQKINEITIGNYPRKVDEYLAMGKPVIATKTDTMVLFKEYVHLCSNLKDYQAALEKALTETDARSAKERRTFAQSHSWENNVKNICTHIYETLNTP